MKEIIHIVLGKANPDRMNGVNKVVYQLASQQALKGRKVSVWGITQHSTNNYGERVFETQLFRSSKNPFSVHQSLRLAIAAKKDDAVFHLHGGWIPVFYMLSRIFAKHNIRFVITPHGAYNTVAMQRSPIVKKIYFQLFEKVLLTRAARIHCIGHSEVAGTNCLAPGSKIFLAPYGYESPEQNVPLVAQDQKKFVVGFVGRLDIYTKGLDLLLDAFAALHRLESNSVLWLVGDSNEKARLEKMIADKNIPSVVCWGSRFGEEKRQLMEQMSVFVHASRNEGLPASVLEASAMGIPPLVTLATNMGRFVSDYGCGMVTENENAGALASALLLMKREWDSGLLHKKRLRARTMVSELFNWNRVIGEFDKLYAS